MCFFAVRIFSFLICQDLSAIAMGVQLVGRTLLLCWWVEDLVIAMQCYRCVVRLSSWMCAGFYTAWASPTDDVRHCQGTPFLLTLSYAGVVGD